MKAAYGSDRVDVDGDAVVVESTAFMRRKPRQDKTAKAKRVLAAAALVLAAGGATVAYHQTMGTMTLDAEPLTLEANQLSGADVLKSGKPFQLRNVAKNLCADDGGGINNGQTKFVLQPCDATSVNQVFQYDAATKLFRNDAKGKCIDDDTGWTILNKLQIWSCDGNNIHQKFDYVAATQQIKNTATNKCLDDGGGTTAGQTKFYSKDCDASSANQRFEIVPVVYEPKKVAALNLIMSGAPFQLRNADKNLCADDGGGSNNGETKFVLQPCDASSMNQVFQYDPATKLLRNDAKGKCIDDDTGWTILNKLQIWSCDSNNIHQKFDYVTATQQIRNTATNKCLDDGGGKTAGQTKFYSNDCDASSTNQRFDIVPIVWDPKQLAVINTLTSGTPFQLRIAEKNLCVDDGGGTGNGQTKFVLQPCDVSSINQVFQYDAATKLMRSRAKGKCVDDGGGLNIFTKFQLWDCDANNNNQKFDYIRATKQFRSIAKEKCMDDGGGTTAGQTQFHLWDCVASTPNQRFEILPILPDPKKVASINALMQGSPVMLRIAEKDMCMDDGGGTSNGQTKFVLQPCDPMSPNQVFEYDAANKIMRSSAKPKLCVDDAAGWENGQTKFHLWQCDASNINQRFEYLPDTQQFKSIAKKKCIDDGGGQKAGETQFHLWDCVAATPNQRFQIMPVASRHIPPMLRDSQEVVLALADKPGLCMDDGGGHSNGETKFSNANCNGQSENEIFVYDPEHFMFRSARKPNMCLDDGGSHFAGETQFHLWECGTDNINQRFVYDESTMQVRNPVKQQCIDDGGGQRAGESRYIMQPCAAGSSNQRFVIYSPSDPAVAGKMTWVVDHPLLQNGQNFIMRADNKPNLCVDNGGGALVQLQTCDMGNMNQVFQYDAASYSIRSMNQAGMCVDDGGGTSNGQTKFRLAPCEPSSKNQKFVYDQTTQLFRNPMKSSLCMDDGGAVRAGQTGLHLWDCAATNSNQHFLLLPWMPQAPPTPPPQLMVPDFLQNGHEIMIFPAAKPGVCVDDGGGTTNGQTKFRDGKCDSFGVNQVFVYDPANSMFRSASKPNMCLDDGGSHFAGETQFHLWECGTDNINQRFIYEQATQHIRNPVKDQCMDSSNGQYTMQPCSSSPDQAFSIMWRSEVRRGMPHPPVQPVPPLGFVPPHPNGNMVFVMGKRFLLRQVSKGNLCLGFGPPLGNGQFLLAPQPCDPASPFLQFVHDTDGLVIRSVMSPGLCIDDGWSCEERTMRLIGCNPDSYGQKFVYNEGTMTLETAMRNHMCIDDNGSTLFANTKYLLSECDPAKPTQQFEVVGIDMPNPVQPQPPLMPPPGVAFPPGGPMPPGIAYPPGVFPPGGPLPPGIAYPPGMFPPGGPMPPPMPGKKFVLRQAMKGNMCLGFGQPLANGEVQISLRPCALQNPFIQFVYDADHSLVHSATKPNLCLDDGWLEDERTLRLSECDSESDDQKFVYNAATQTLENPVRGSMCIDDNGEQAFMNTVFRLVECDVSRPNQRFEVVGFEESYPPPGAVPPGMPPMPIVVGNGTLWSSLDEGGVTTDIQTVEPIMVGPGGIYRPPTTENEQQPELPDEGGVTANVETVEPIMVGPGGIYRPPTPEDEQQPELPDEGGVTTDIQTIEPMLVGPGGIYNPPTPDEEPAPFAPMSLDEPVDAEPQTEPQPVDPANPNPEFEPSMYDDGDWNLLAPSKTTIHIVNSDGSDDITSGEIFAYLLGLKDTAEATYVKMLSKYHRTSQCVSRGLESLAKTSITEAEYHALVQWMYEHCVAGSGTTAPLPPVEPAGVPTEMPQSTDVDRVYMTKLEFYQQIKNHFASEREELAGAADAAHLRTGIGATQKLKLQQCIEDASNRFGRENEYDDPAHFHDAILWVNDTCMNAP